jgi:glycosyltransferase involved in cell wall biosynthesis
VTMDTRPLLSVIVPTVGRPSVERAVNSLLRQGEWLPYEVILVGDTHGGTWAEQLPRARALAEQYPEHVRYVEHDGGVHMVGHPQRNFGATVARGRYLSWLGDDDVYCRFAFPSIARALRARVFDHPRDQRVHLFRWISPWKQLMWHTAGFLEEGHIDAECIVAPNVPDKLGVWGNRYQGDFDFIAETVEHWGGLEKVIWQPEIIAQARPDPAEDWTTGGHEVAPVEAYGVPFTVVVPHVVPPRPREVQA